MKNKRINKNTLLLIFFVFLETIVIKLLQYKLLPTKFFYDSITILELMNSTINSIGGSFAYVANIFNKINFMHFATLQQWSIAISVIFTYIIVHFLSKNDNYKFSQIMFIIASVALLNIYVFNLSKDIIQFTYFLLIYLVLKSKFKNITKLILCSAILMYEALNFRVYYAIMVMVMITIYAIYNVFIKNRSLNKKNVLNIIMLFIFSFFIEVFFVQLISNNNYNAILNARYDVNLYRQDSLDALTIINDPLGQNTNFIKFIANYLINFVRMNLPIELLFKGIIYIPFIIYQMYILFQLIKNIKTINDNNILLLDTIISFIMISVIFEPDFGSFIRHETALMLILLELINIQEKDNNKKKDKNLKKELY